MTMSLVLSSVEVAAGPTVVALPKDKPELVGTGFTFATSEEGDSSETSSIGVASSSSSSSSSSDGDRDEAESKPRDGAFASLDSLEESLPIKRGLSNCFAGKSKSFASLSECASSSSTDLAKPENPFNKRRRILMAANKNSSWSRRASCSSLLTQLPPLQGVEEGEEEEDERGPPLAPLPHGGKFHRAAPFKSPRSFSLSDLQHA